MIAGRRWIRYRAIKSPGSVFLQRPCKDSMKMGSRKTTGFVCSLDRASMREWPTDNRTISQLEAEGYPWIGCECCKGTVWVPFRMLRERIPMLSAKTLDQLGQLMWWFGGRAYLYRQPYFG